MPAHANHKALSQRQLNRLKKFLAPEFRWKHAGDEFGGLPLYEQVESGIEFRLIPEGTFSMGLSAEEEQAARAICDPPPLTLSEMRPVRKRTIRRMLMSARAISTGDVKRVLGEEPLLGWTRDEPDDLPAYVQRDAALAFARKWGCRLPFEAEWEYACRGGSTTLFVWGNRLPADSRLNGWLDLRRTGKWKPNGFGLYGLFTGDWCTDEYRPSHADDAVVVPGAYVIKGGGSVFWPWQGCGEWIWCMPATRMPSTELFDDKTCSFRLVRELPELL